MQSTKRFYLIRHGEKEKIYGDPPLSDTGILPAQQPGAYLQQFPISQIFTSPLLRTRQTGKYIADQLGLQPEINNLLKERANWGDDPHQSLANFMTMWQKASVQRSWQPPLGDSSINAGQRMERVIADLLPSPNTHIVLVTHGGIITDFLRNLFTENELDKFIPGFSTTLDNNIKECSITIVDVDSKTVKSRLVSLADTKHLK